MKKTSHYSALAKTVGSQEITGTLKEKKKKAGKRKKLLALVF